MANLLDRILAHPDVVKPPDRNGEAQAWCPWHADKAGGKPSLGINQKKEAVKCWVCDKGGIKDLAEAWGLLDQSPSAAPWEKEIERTYDYRKADGSLLFQVVRFKSAPSAPKDIAQRQPMGGDWQWSLKNIRTVPYRLPELREADEKTWVYVPEGEKDVDRLVTLGLVATTNPMGAHKWRDYCTKELKGRLVAILPDNDEGGRIHAADVAQKLSGVAASVRVIELGDLPDKGDVSDWLDAGHSIDELSNLVDATPEYVPPADSEESGSNGDDSWEGSRHRPISKKILSAMQEQGFFVTTPTLSATYYFHDPTKTLFPLDRDDPDLRVFLNRAFSVNRQDQLYLYALEEMTVEAYARGRRADVAHFSHFSEETHQLYVDMGRGKILRMDGKTITEGDNGADGVLFAPDRRFRPWTYKPNAPEGLVASTLIESLEFSEGDASSPSSHTPQEQRLLLFIWMLTLAFESLQPTKPLVLAVGPNGSGKSNFFRRVGKLLFGEEFNVTEIEKDKEAEFWTTVTNRPFAAFDNVDRYIPWLEDALATVSTGVERTIRQLYTTNTAATFKPRCFVGLTARAPLFRREDVASRMLIFRLDKVKRNRREKELLDEVVRLRDELLSDYVKLLNRVVANPFVEAHSVDPTIRLADFVGVATWIGSSLGPDAAVDVIEALNKLKATQFTFATEEDELMMLLEMWVDDTHHPPGQMIETPNTGRAMITSDLLPELRAKAESVGMTLHIPSPVALGRKLEMQQEAMSIKLDVTRKHTEKGNTWAFARAGSPETEWQTDAE